MPHQRGVAPPWRFLSESDTLFVSTYITSTAVTMFSLAPSYQELLNYGVCLAIGEVDPDYGISQRTGALIAFGIAFPQLIIGGIFYNKYNGDQEFYTDTLSGRLLVGTLLAAIAQCISSATASLFEGTPFGHIAIVISPLLASIVCVFLHAARHGL